MSNAPQTTVSRESVAPYAWGDGCIGWHLVRAGELSVIQEEMPPGAAEVRHRHRRARQFFYVLTGVLAIDCDGVRHVLGPQTGIEIAATVPHQVVNASDAKVEFLVISQPASHGDREVVE